MQLCPFGGQGTTCHRQPYMCAVKRFKDLTKKKVYGNSKFHFFFLCNPQDFLQEINYCFVFCNLKAATGTFLRYSRRPKHVWEETKYMKRDGWFIFNVLNILDYLFYE